MLNNEDRSKGGRKLRERYGEDYHKKLGELGGNATKEKHGSEHYIKAGKKGNERKKELIEKGRQAEQAEETSLTGEVTRCNHIT